MRVILQAGSKITLTLIQSLSTCENRNVISYDPKIFTGIFSALNRQKNKDIFAFGWKDSIVIYI